MSSILMVVRDEFTAQSPDVRFIECNHMIEAFSAGGTDHRSATPFYQGLRMPVLTGSMAEDLSNARHLGAEFGIAV